MPNHLSTLGIIHTIISILAIIYGFIALYQDGRINPRNNLGKGYIVLTVLTCLTSFGIMKTGHFTPAHTLSVLVLILLPIAIYARSIKFLGAAGEKVEVIIMMATLFLSFIPAVTETLTRLPISGPIAVDQDAAIIKMVLLALLVIFTVGTIYLVRRLRKPLSV